MQIELQFLSQIADIEPQQWDDLTGCDYPFLQHRFLHALEQSGSVQASTGWQPHHLLVRQHGRLVAIMPLYLKSHSYGEYVFDWSWADAYQRHGLEYYPKLLAAIPFTPATGPRLCIARDIDSEDLLQALIPALQQHARELNVSSFHLLFPEQQQAAQIAANKLSMRLGVQYHWFNHGYQNFDDFLARMTSRKRKNVRKERQKISAQGLQLEVFSGEQLTKELMDRFYHFYQITYARRSGHGGYLSRDFFHRIADQMADQTVLVLASQQQHSEYLAGALYFKDQHTLYGRYWGCLEDYDSLHFEACYYQGIDYCIQQQLQRFDPGAQGEHKIQRGFEPILTYSCHQLMDKEFQLAVEDFVSREAPAVEEYLQQAAGLLPFKADE